MSRSASSRSSTPATVAATYSPIECPATALGSIPHDRHSCARLYSTAKSAGCVYAVWCTSSADLGIVPVEHVQQRRREHAVQVVSACVHRGPEHGLAPVQPGAIPGCWAPWPVNTKATCGRPDSSRTRDAGRVLLGEPRAEARCGLRSGAGDHAQPVREASSPDLGRPRHVRQPLGRVLQVISQASRLRTQRGLVAPRHGEDLRPAGLPARGRRAGAPPR